MITNSGKVTSWYGFMYLRVLLIWFHVSRVSSRNGYNCKNLEIMFGGILPNGHGFPVRLPTSRYDLAPPLVWRISHYLLGFYVSQVVSRISEPSTVAPVIQGSNSTLQNCGMFVPSGAEFLQGKESVLWIKVFQDFFTCKQAQCFKQIIKLPKHLDLILPRF